jgi:acetylglutamate kinase
VKIGGRAQDDPRAATALAALWRSSAGALVVVHGGGDEVTRLQRAFAVEPNFVGGRRVTRAEDLDLLRMALSGAANKRLVSRLAAAGVPAMGISGEDAGILSAIAADPATMGFTGAECHADPAPIRHLLAGGYLPVISPLAFDRSPGSQDHDGRPALNVNGDDAAAAIAVALAADELILVSDVSHVMNGGVMLELLSSADVGEVLSSGAATGGMSAKLEAAIAASEGGVKRVRISDVQALSDPARGTAIVPAAQAPSASECAA